MEFTFDICRSYLIKYRYQREFTFDIYKRDPLNKTAPSKRADIVSMNRNSFNWTNLTFFKSEWNSRLISADRIWWHRDCNTLQQHTATKHCLSMKRTSLDKTNHISSRNGIQIWYLSIVFDKTVYFSFDDTFHFFDFSPEFTCVLWGHFIFRCKSSNSWLTQIEQIESDTATTHCNNTTHNITLEISMQVISIKQTYSQQKRPIEQIESDTATTHCNNTLQQHHTWNLDASHFH